MAGLTFGGKSAQAVATRHHTLPLAGIAEAKRDERRAKEADRQDRHIRAAAWRGRQCAYLAERIRRLEPIRARLSRWLDCHDWKDDRWQHRNKRYWTVACTVRAHERELRGYVEKVDGLARNKPMKQQEAITAAYFAARNAPPPSKRPAKLMGDPE